MVIWKEEREEEISSQQQQYQEEESSEFTPLNRRVFPIHSRSYSSNAGIEHPMSIPSLIRRATGGNTEVVTAISHSSSIYRRSDNNTNNSNGITVRLTPRGEYLRESSLSVAISPALKLEDPLANMVAGILPPPGSAESPRTAPFLTMWPLAVLIFYTVSGGPFGIEPSIRAAGNIYCILGFLIFPFVWAVPEALMTAELGAAFQDASGGVAWVEHAFGEGMGGICGYLGWVSGATDNAIYPTLFMEYVASVAGWDKDAFSGWTRFLSLTTITITLAMLNYTGLEIVGKSSLTICIIAMSPFLIMTILGAPKVVPSRWFQMPDSTEDASYALFDDDFQTSPGPLPLLTLGGILWRPWLSNMFWSLGSYDSAASFAGETAPGSSTYLKGIFLGLIMTIVAYIIPLLVAVGATDYDQAEWVDGHLANVAVDIGGKWLGVWTVFAAGINNVALFEAEMSSDAFKIMGMAESGYLPKIFASRSKYGTPKAGIILNTIVIITFSCANFGQLLELLNSVYAISLLMEYAAFVKLRLYHKELKRPWRIPGPDWAVVLMVIPPTIGVVFVLATSNWYIWAFAVGSLIFGVLVMRLTEVSKDRGWFEYCESKADRRNLYDPPTNNIGDDDKTEFSSTPSIHEPTMHWEQSPQQLFMGRYGVGDLTLYEERELT